MVHKTELEAWQLQPVDEPSTTDGWFARATAVMNSAFSMTNEESEDFCPDEASVDDGLLVRRHRSASSLSSSFEGSQAGDGENSTDLSSLHGSLKVLARVIMAEYRLPTETLMQIKATTSMPREKLNRPALRQFHNLRHNRNEQNSKSRNHHRSQRQYGHLLSDGAQETGQQQRSGGRTLSFYKRFESFTRRSPKTLRSLCHDYHRCHRLLIDASSNFEFPPAVPPQTAFRISPTPFTPQHVLKARLRGTSAVRQPQVRYNREMLSHKLPATLLRCLLAHKDLLGRHILALPFCTFLVG